MAVCHNTLAMSVAVPVHVLAVTDITLVLSIFRPYL